MNEEELEQNGEEIQENESHENNPQAAHPFDQMFFGNRQRPIRRDRIDQDQQKADEPPPINGWLEGLLNSEQLRNINYDELMDNIDKLMTSLNELKPMFKKVSPFIQRFIQKEK